MPGLDQRGPQGAGPRSGGGLGNCNGAGRSGRGNKAGRRNGAGRCGGRQRARRQAGGGRRQNAGSAVSAPQGTAGEALGRLQHRARQLAAELRAVESRLAEAGDATTDTAAQ
jgi:hypothetical protein